MLPREQRGHVKQGWRGAVVMLWLRAMVSKRILTVSVAAAMPLAGCAASDERYPSLAIRDVERAAATMPVEPPAAPDGVAPLAPTPAAVLAELPRIVERARTAHRAFQNTAPRASRAASAARGTGFGSDAWANAFVALAELESRRSQTAIALGDLDRLYADMATQLADAGPVIEARNQVIKLMTQEDATLARLRAQMPR